jgi:hypothetical protein
MWWRVGVLIFITCTRFHTLDYYSILRLLLKALRRISMAAGPKENIFIENKVFWMVEALIKDTNKKVFIMALDGRRWIIG